MTITSVNGLKGFGKSFLSFSGGPFPVPWSPLLDSLPPKCREANPPCNQRSDPGAAPKCLSLPSPPCFTGFIRTVRGPLGAFCWE